VLLELGIRALGQHVSRGFDQFGAAKVVGLLHLLKAVPYGNRAIHFHARSPKIVENFDLSKWHRLYGITFCGSRRRVERLYQTDAWNQTTAGEQQGTAGKVVVREDAHRSS